MRESPIFCSLLEAIEDASSLQSEEFKKGRGRFLRGWQTKGCGNDIRLEGLQIFLWIQVGALEAIALAQSVEIFRIFPVESAEVLPIIVLAANKVGQ